MGLFRARPGQDNLWDFLGKCATAKNRVKLEEARNRGTQEAIAALPPGAVLREGGTDWYREINIPDQPPPALISLTTANPTIMDPGCQQPEAPLAQPGSASGELEPG
jgi:hypothetical protein